MSEIHRIALIRCIALTRTGGNAFEEVSSVSVKLHAASPMSALLETITAQTQRHGALWQDAYSWDKQGSSWRQVVADDSLFHLLEVFSMAQQFCETGVVPAAHLCHSRVCTQGSVETLCCTLLSDGSTFTSLEPTTSPPVLATEPLGQRGSVSIPQQMQSMPSLSHAATNQSGLLGVAVDPLMEMFQPGMFNASAASPPAQQPYTDTNCHQPMHSPGQAAHECPLPHIRPSPLSSAVPSLVETPQLSQDLSDLFQFGNEDELTLTPFSHESSDQEGLLNAADPAIVPGTAQRCKKRRQSAGMGHRTSSREQDGQDSECTTPADQVEGTAGDTPNGAMMAPSTKPEGTPSVRRQQTAPARQRQAPLIRANKFIGSQEATYSSDELTESSYQVPPHLILVIRTVRRDMCSFVLPSTLLTLLSLGPEVITVSDVLHSVMPFSCGAAIAYKRLLTDLRSDETLQQSAALTALADMEKACALDAFAMRLLLDESIADITQHGPAEAINVKEATESISKELYGRRLKARSQFSRRVIYPRLVCDFCAMAISEPWQNQVKPLAQVCHRYSGRKLKFKEFTDLTKAVQDFMQDNNSHQGLVRMTIAWLKRLDRMVNTAVSSTDSCVVQFQKITCSFHVYPLSLKLAKSIHELLDGTPGFGTILGQYASSFASEILCNSSSEVTVGRKKAGACDITPKLRTAMQQSIRCCLAAARRVSGSPKQQGDARAEASPDSGQVDEPPPMNCDQRFTQGRRPQNVATGQPGRYDHRKLADRPGSPPPRHAPKRASDEALPKPSGATCYKRKPVKAGPDPAPAAHGHVQTTGRVV